jgi:hypothetical protein
MAATVTIDETNGAAPGTVTGNITNSNMGNVDAANLNPVTYPVSAGANTFEKWQRFDLTSLGGSSAIENLKVWRTGALGGSAVHLTNARTSAYAGAQAYVQPVSTVSTIATQTMPTSAPTSANLGIAGSLTAQLTAVGYSDYLVHQIQTNASDVAGSTSTLNYQYDEVA